MFPSWRKDLVSGVGHQIATLNECRLRLFRFSTAPEHPMSLFLNPTEATPFSTHLRYRRHANPCGRIQFHASTASGAAVLGGNDDDRRRINQALDVYEGRRQAV